MIQQPAYWGQLHFWNRVLWSDGPVVLLDDVKFTDHWWIHRTKVVDKANMERWMTASLSKRGILDTLIKDVVVAEGTDFAKDHKNWLSSWYSLRNEGFDFVMGCLDKVAGMTHIAEIDAEITRTIIEWLGLKRDVFMSSECGEWDDKSQRLVDLAKMFDADNIIVGEDSMSYIGGHRVFGENGIGVTVQNWSPPDGRDASIVDAIIKNRRDEVVHVFEDTKV